MEKPVRIFAIPRLPKFLEEATLETQKLISPVRDPESRFAYAAREGSLAVREWKANRERRRRDRESVTALVDGDTEKNIPDPGPAPESTDNALPPPSADELRKQRLQLPAVKAKEEFMQLVRENQVTIVVGETGSGKTTQLPQFLLELGGPVVVTQPRRVAAISVAARVAAERGSRNDLGGEVGYSVRFDDRTTPKTRLRFVTDGILLREFLTDPDLERYSAFVIDEAHERALNTDILLGLLRRLLARRADLRIVVTSATLNASQMSEFFGHAPTFFIKGREYPVHVHHLQTPTSDYVSAAVRQVAAIHIQHASPDSGDILVFMTGQDDIEATCSLISEKLRQLGATPALVLPFYAQLPPNEQARVFVPDTERGRRKIVVATNVAETSLTIPGIKFVVDSGFVKMSVYQPSVRMDALQLVPISKAAAAQRSGRAGRIAEGFAFRMWTTQQEASELLAATVPEIKRTNLTQVVLLLKSLGVADPASFPFLDAPPPAALSASLYDLWALGALDEGGALTSLGNTLAKFPLDPHMARLVSAGVEYKCSDEIIIILALLSGPPVFLRTAQRAAEADRARERFAVAGSDHLTLVNLWRQWKAAGKYADSWATKNFLNARALRRADDTRKQLAAIVERTLKVRLVSCGDNNDCLRRAICAGYFHQAARTRGLRSYVGLRTSVTALVHPTSVLAGRGALPEYVVFHDLVLTSQKYLVTITAVEPQWLLEDGPMFYSSEISDWKRPISSAESHAKLDSLPDSEDTESPTDAPKPKFKRVSAAKNNITKRPRVFRGA